MRTYLIFAAILFSLLTGCQSNPNRIILSYKNKDANITAGYDLTQRAFVLEYEQLKEHCHD